jgi:hypothetical protein
MRKLGIAILMAAFAATAWAQQKSGDQSAPGAVTDIRSDGGIALKTDATQANANVPAISGGVSVNARDDFRARRGNHNVRLVFALTTGNYVSDVQVQVKDSAGKVVIDDTSNGPWLFATLPPGSYTATATFNGSAKTQRFSVGKGKGVQTAHFRWPASVEGRDVGAAANSAGGEILGTGPQEAQPQPPR